MAKKYEDPTQLKDKVVKARVTAEEKDKLKELANKMFMSESDFIRYVINNFDYEYFKN